MHNCRYSHVDQWDLASSRCNEALVLDAAGRATDFVFRDVVLSGDVGVTEKGEWARLKTASLLICEIQVLVSWLVGTSQLAYGSL